MKRVRDKFQGALLGTLLGDAVGAPWEGADAARIKTIFTHYPLLSPDDQKMHRDVFGILLSDETRHARYTDDTQMTLALAETLVEHGDAAHETDNTRFEAALADRFADRFDPTRLYGPGAYRVLTGLRCGAPWDEPAKRLFRGVGSFGNGAAMRGSHRPLVPRCRNKSLASRCATQRASHPHAPARHWRSNYAVRRGRLRLPPKPA